MPCRTAREREEIEKKEEDTRSLRQAIKREVIMYNFHGAIVPVKNKGHAKRKNDALAVFILSHVNLVSNFSTLAKKENFEEFTAK